MIKQTRLLVQTLLVFILLGVFPVITGAAVDAGSGLSYDITEDGTATITEFNAPGGFTGDLAIPATLGGANVTAIGEMAFFYCDELTSVDLPSSVTEIKTRGFFSCNNLQTITGADNVRYIEERAFYGCSSLTSITDLVSLTGFGEYAFRDCSSLAEFTIPEGVTRLSDYLFYNCGSLTSIDIPESITSIGKGAFRNCAGLEEIVIPTSVTDIGDYAFNGCSSLQELEIPASVNNIGDGLFAWCGSIQRVSIPEGITTLGNSMFSQCTNLTSVTLPESITVIEGWAFNGCSSLSGISLPNQVIDIGTNAFKDCTNLTSVTLPASLTNIGTGAFDGCAAGLTIYGYAGTYAETFADENGFNFISLENPLIITAAEGGSIISGDSGNYEEGEVISIAAGVEPGYLFSHWATNAGGSFAEVHSAATTFTMPANGVTITANFSAAAPPNWPGESKLNISAINLKSVVLNWSAAEDPAGISGYKLYQDAEELVTVAGELHTYNVGGLSPDTDYTFQVQAENAHGAWTADGPSITVTTRRDKSSASPAVVADLRTDTFEELLAVEMDWLKAQAVAVLTEDTFQRGLSNASVDKHGQKTLRVSLFGSDPIKTCGLTVPVCILDVKEDWQINFENPLGSLLITGNGQSVTEKSFTAKTNAENLCFLLSQGTEADIVTEEGKIVQGKKSCLQITLKGGKLSSDKEVADIVPVKLVLPCTLTATELANSEYLTVWRIGATGKGTPLPGAFYDKKSGAINFWATQTGEYVVGYHRNTFSDLSETEWARKSIEVLAGKGIINGTGENTYSPSAEITRADYLILLLKTLGLTATVEDNFADVSPDAYYYEAIGSAKKLGLASGIGHNCFNPEGNISRQDMMVLTARALTQYRGLEARENLAGLARFIDKDEIVTYALGSISTLVEHGLVAGTDEKRMNPSAPTTRAEAACFLYRIYLISLN